jgi:hypothetical protein
MSKLKKWVIEQFPSNEDTKYTDENGDWYQVLAVDTILAAKDEEIERLKEDRELAIEAIKKDFAQIQSKAINLEEELSQLRTELAEERRLNAEHEAHFVNTMHRHGVGEFRLETNGWQDILRKRRKRND